MSDGGGKGETRLSRADAERVLALAASRQLRAQADSVSVEELAAAARDAGIDPAHVRAASRELVPRDEARLYGMRTRVLRRRWLERTLDQAALENLGTRLDAIFGAHGRRSVDAGGLTWSARHVHVTVEHDGEGTRIQISERFVNTARSQLVGITFGGGGLGFALGSMLGKVLGMGPLVLAAGLVGATVLGGVGMYVTRRRHAALVERTERDFERALDEIHSAVEALATARALPAADDD